MKLFSKEWIWVFLLSFLSSHPLSYADPEAILAELRNRMSQAQGPSQRAPQSPSFLIPIRHPWPIIRRMSDERTLIERWRQELFSTARNEGYLNGSLAESLLDLFIEGSIDNDQSSYSETRRSDKVVLSLIVDELLSGHDWFQSQQELVTRLSRIYANFYRLGEQAATRSIEFMNRIGDGENLPTQAELNRFLIQNLIDESSKKRGAIILAWPLLVSLRVAQVLRGEMGTEAAILMIQSLADLNLWHQYPVLAKAFLSSHQGPLATNFEFQKQRLRVLFGIQGLQYLRVFDDNDVQAQQTFLGDVLDPFINVVTGPLSSSSDWNPQRWLQEPQEGLSAESYELAAQWVQDNIGMRDLFSKLPRGRGYESFTRLIEPPSQASLIPFLVVSSRLRSAGRLHSDIAEFEFRLIDEIIRYPLWWYQKELRQVFLRVFRTEMRDPAKANPSDSVLRGLQDMEAYLTSRQSIQVELDSFRNNHINTESIERVLSRLQESMDWFEARIAVSEHHPFWSLNQINLEEKVASSILDILSILSGTELGRQALRRTHFSDDLFLKIARRYVERHDSWFFSSHHRSRVLSMMALSGQWGTWDTFDPWSFLKAHRDIPLAAVEEVRAFIIQTLTNERLLALFPASVHSDEPIEEFPMSTRIMMNPMVAEGIARTIRRFGLLEPPPTQDEPHHILRMMVDAITQIRVFPPDHQSELAFPVLLLFWSQVEVRSGVLVFRGEREYANYYDELRRPLRVDSFQLFIQQLRERGVALDSVMVEALGETFDALTHNQSTQRELINKIQEDIQKLLCGKSLTPQ